jgi:hypothetical protein
MNPFSRPFTLFVILASLALAKVSSADSFTFTTGAPDGRMATASRPGLAGKIEIESADDFILSAETLLNSGTFTGLVTGTTPTIGQVDVEIYRVFPQDSLTPPSGNVLTRVNSPSDVAFAEVGTQTANLSFSTTALNSTFTAANSVINGINKFPNQTTGGEGAVTGAEVQFNFNISSLLDLPAGHYFFVPQVQVTGGEFYWLSAPGPAVFTGDLQEWIRNDNLAPDWSRVGTDIVGGGANAPKFNAAFALDGMTVPDSGSTFGLTVLAVAALALAHRALGAKHLA